MKEEERIIYIEGKNKFWQIITGVKREKDVLQDAR
jgi:hypothetical protein